MEYEPRQTTSCRAGQIWFSDRRQNARCFRYRSDIHGWLRVNSSTAKFVSDCPRLGSEHDEHLGNDYNCQILGCWILRVHRLRRIAFFGGVFVADAFHGSRPYMAIVSASAFAMAILSHRFTSKKLHITPMDRASIVIAAGCLLLSFLLGDTYKGIAVFNAGNLSLLLSWYARLILSSHDSKINILLYGLVQPSSVGPNDIRPPEIIYCHPHVVAQETGLGRVVGNDQIWHGGGSDPGVVN